MNGYDMNQWTVGDEAYITAFGRSVPYLARYDGHTWRDVETLSFCVDRPTSIHLERNAHPAWKVVAAFAQIIGLGIAFIIALVLLDLLPAGIHHLLMFAVPLVVVAVYVERRWVTREPRWFAFWTVMLLITAVPLLRDLSSR